MGKKSREKRERRIARIKADPRLLLPTLHPFLVGLDHRQNKQFSAGLEATRTLFRQYQRSAAALALSISELWLANVGSPIKHLFAWGVLLDLSPDDQGEKSISCYADFKEFAEALYAAWPAFPMLEDFSPEADWGQIKVKLGQRFVPMFYGSCIERTPDFVEAFRITYAHIPEALAHMDVAIALQAQIIESMTYLGSAPVGESQRAHVEVPPQDFWLICISSLPRIGSEIGKWRERADGELETRFGAFKAPLTWQAFGEAAMRGAALPFLAVIDNDMWLPMSVRSGPSVVIDHWAKKEVGVDIATHRQLAIHVAERFRGTAPGPLALMVDDTACEDLTISCVVSSDSGVYLICACDHSSIERVAIGAKNAYALARSGELIHFRMASGRHLMLSKDGATGPRADELQIILVLTQSGTEFSSVVAPEKPTRILPLADFITILDSLGEFDELNRFWEYVDSQRDSLTPFSTGPADLFASFKDANGVLVDGAISPTVIALDPHWGTSWRFKVLTAFWSLAPKIFPDGSSGWRLSEGTAGVVELQSRRQKVFAYSTLVGNCTVQTLFEITEELILEDARMMGLFAQLLADCAHRCNDVLQELALFEQSYVLFICRPDEAFSIDETASNPPAGIALPAITSAQLDRRRKGWIHLKVDVRSVFAGLSEAKNGSFEVQCLMEVLEASHAACGLNFVDGVAERLRSRAAEPARYHLMVVNRMVDVPDYVEPVVPSPMDYKLARKQLAKEILALGLQPGRYELTDAKALIDPASDRLRDYLEQRLAALNRHQLLQGLIEQHDALLIYERIQIQRARQSLAHAVEYDRLDAVEEARKTYGEAARHYRYLLEKTVSSAVEGKEPITNDILRQLVGLVDWYMVLSNASDVLHNGLDVGGVVIDDSYIPEVFYSGLSDSKEEKFTREYAKARLGIGSNSEDAVEGASKELLESARLKAAFTADAGFDLHSLVASLALLSHSHTYGFSTELSLSYSAPKEQVVQVLSSNIEGMDRAMAERIVSFLTLSETGVRRLSGRDVDELDVPYWEHSKRVHRYAIRPLIVDGLQLRWGAESVSNPHNLA